MPQLRFAGGAGNGGWHIKALQLQLELDEVFHSFNKRHVLLSRP
jgi:hypothetical protein